MSDRQDPTLQNAPRSRRGHRRADSTVPTAGPDDANGSQSVVLPLCALGTVLLVLAGSLSPFHFDLAAARAAGGVGLRAIGWPNSAHDDLVTNIAVYVPVGAASFLWLRRRSRAWLALVLVGVFGGVTSLLAETLQTCIPVRTASWIDVIVNVLGSLCGAAVAPALCAAAHLAGRRIRDGVTRQPMSTAAGVLAVGLILVGLRPFDFVTTTEALHASLARSQWLWAETGISRDGGGGPAAADISTIGMAGAFAALGFLLALGARETRHSRRRAAAASLVHVALLAVLIETVQVFVVSRSFDVWDALLTACGGALGTYLAIYAVDAPSRSAWLGRPAMVLHPVLLGPALILQIGYHLAHAATPFQSMTAQTAGSTVLWVPFSGYYGRSLVSVMSQVLSVGAAFALLGLTVALLARGLGSRTRWWVAAGAVLTVAAVREVIQCANAAHVADTTDPLVALAALMLAALACRDLRTAHAPRWPDERPG